MSELLRIIKGTPFYVWIILGYLLFIGIKSLRTQIVYLPKLFIIPLVLLSIRYTIFLSQDVIVFCFVIFLGVIGSFGIHMNKKITIIKNAKSIEVPGSYVTLVLLISFFAVKYYFGALKSIAPDVALKFSFIEHTMSGLFSGYFIGRALGYVYQYWKR
jgi:hypothetical protein